MAARPSAMQAMNDARDKVQWRLPSAQPQQRRQLCSLAQPSLSQATFTPQFHVHDAAVLLIASGSIAFDDGVSQLTVDAPDRLLLVDANTRADLLKTPGGTEQRFRSVFLSLAPEQLDAFARQHPVGSTGPAESGKAAPCLPCPPFRMIELDADLASTYWRVCESVGDSNLSDARLHYRVMELLMALAERGYTLRRGRQTGTADRLRTLIGEAPEYPWTAHEAARALAMSEATLRRRLVEEEVRFETLLMDIRMHHAMLLLQTTAWSIPHVAQACGYQSRARFSERFRARFGYLPSHVR